MWTPTPPTCLIALNKKHTYVLQVDEKKPDYSLLEKAVNFQQLFSKDRTDVIPFLVWHRLNG